MSDTGIMPDGSKKQVALHHAAETWGTPRASDGEKGGPNQSFGAGGMPLPAQAAQWPTPMAGTPAQNGNSAAGNSDFTRRADMLAEQVMQASARPTPSALQDTKGDTARVDERIASGKQVALAHRARAFTPPALPTRQGGDMPSPHAPISRPLWAWMTQSLGRPVSRRLWKGRSKRRLNPLFVEWLQAWPCGHALCACSETEFTRWQQDMRSALSQLPTASGPWIWAPTDGAETAEPQQFSLFV